MRITLSVFIAAVLHGSAASAASVADGFKPGWSSDSVWPRGIEARIISKVVFAGYEQAVIVSEDGVQPFRSASGNRMRGEMRGRLRLNTRYLHLDFEPYTRSPSDVIKASAGGVEVNILLPATDWLRLGLYHHSAHNFGDGDYGVGIELNAWALDLRLFSGTAILAGDWQYQLRFVGHYYMTGRAPSHVITGRADVAPSEIGGTRWRSGFEFEAEHRRVTLECGWRLAASPRAPTSMSAACDAVTPIGPVFLDDLGERLRVGGFADYGQNFSRFDHFGRFGYTVGLRIDILLADTLPVSPAAN